MGTELGLWLELLNPGLENARRILWLACAKLYGMGTVAGESAESVRDPTVAVGEVGCGGDAIKR